MGNSHCSASISITLKAQLLTEGKKIHWREKHRRTYWSADFLSFAFYTNWVLKFKKQGGRGSVQKLPVLQSVEHLTWAGLCWDPQLVTCSSSRKRLSELCHSAHSCSDPAARTHWTWSLLEQNTEHLPGLQKSHKALWGSDCKKDLIAMSLLGTRYCRATHELTLTRKFTPPFHDPLHFLTLPLWETDKRSVLWKRPTRECFRVAGGELRNENPNNGGPKSVSTPDLLDASVKKSIQFLNLPITLKMLT